MFLIIWSEEAFDQMQQILLDHPDRRADIAGAALRQLNRDLDLAADTWGQSRAGND